jgi:hypothetical protein
MIHKTIDTPYSNNIVIIYTFFGSAPFVLMFIERLKSTGQEIKNSLWYGIFIIITDFIFRTIIINGNNVESTFSSLIYIKRDITVYKWYTYPIDLLRSSLVLFACIAIIIGIAIMIKYLVRLYHRFKPSILRSLMHMAMVIIFSAVYVYIYAKISPHMGELQAGAIANMLFLSIPRLLISYSIIILLVIVITYVKNQSIDLKNVFHLTFVIYLGYTLGLVLITIMPILWKPVDYLLIDGKPNVSFRYYFSTIIGIVLTIITYFITRVKNETSQDVIYSYKAIVVLIYVAYLIFM